MESSKRILIVDDEEDIIELISYNLKQEGYIIEYANNGKEAIDKALEFRPDLILLDVMMPVMDGIEACEEIRKIPQISNCIIAFLTARNEDYSQIAGFKAGADDYISKPIKPKVLTSRISALLKRVKSSSNTASTKEIKIKQNNIIKLSDSIILDEEGYCVKKDGADIQLTKKEFELLKLLCLNGNKVVRREHIFSVIWGSDVFVGDRTIDVHIRKIREKTGLDSIKTIKGVGYKYEN